MSHLIWVEPVEYKNGTHLVCHKFFLGRVSRSAVHRSISSIILSPDFVRHWARLRNELPLEPNNSHMKLSDDDAEGTSTKIYSMMTSVWEAKYDSATTEDCWLWRPYEHFENLVYHIAHSLARPDGMFHEAFMAAVAWPIELNHKALNCIVGIAMICSNLIREYVGMDPHTLISDLERAKPTSNSQLSPLPEIRKRWELQQIDVGDLRLKVIEEVKKHTEEQMNADEDVAKEFYVSWLVNEAAGYAGETLTQKIKILSARFKRPAEE